MFGRQYLRNPRELVPAWAFELVQLWRLCQGEFGLQHLPDPGGMGDQPAWTMDAFGILAAADRELREEERRASDHGTAP